MEEEEHSQGVGVGIIKYFILLIIVGIILLIFYPKVFDIWRKSADTEDCRRSVELHAAGSLQGLKTIEELQCRPTDEVIRSANVEDVKKQTADLMAECFWKFGANEFDLFSSTVFTEERFCALCSQIKYSGAARGQTIKDFGTYLATHTVSPRYAKDTTYMQYVIGRPTTPSELTAITAPGQVVIDTNKDYAVMFVYVKHTHLQEGWAALAGIGGGTGVALAGALLLIPDFGLVKLPVIALVSVAGGLAGGYAGGNIIGSERAADWQTAVLLVPLKEDELKKLSCTSMPVDQRTAQSINTKTTK